MAIQKLKSDNATFSLRYRAVCKKKDHTGDWYYEKSEALADALQHQVGKDDHYVEIEIEQKQNMKVSLKHFTK